MDVSVGKKVKKTLGKRKIEIKKIEKKTDLAVTFNKRRYGLFKKASELAILCAAEIAILVELSGGKMFTFGHPSADAVTHRFLTGESSQMADVFRPVEMERSRMEENESELIWWDKPMEGMELHEFEDYLESLQGLSDNVSNKLQEMEKLNCSVLEDFDPIDFIDFTC